MSDVKPVITYEEFDKIDLRVATILEAIPVPDTTKLMLLKVDLGFEHRQIVAGIKLYHSPESLIGKQIIIVANLAPRKMCGIESQGMLLAASFLVSDPENPLLGEYMNRLALASTTEHVKPGTQLH
jgi:methionine--tRNA ligase beta chain